MPRSSRVAGIRSRMISELSKSPPTQDRQFARQDRPALAQVEGQDRLKESEAAPQEGLVQPRGFFRRCDHLFPDLDSLLGGERQHLRRVGPRPDGVINPAAHDAVNVAAQVDSYDGHVDAGNRGQQKDRGPQKHVTGESAQRHKRIICDPARRGNWPPGGDGALPAAGTTPRNFQAQ